MTTEITKHILFIGLGNPGKKYEMTRHNMGYLVVQGFAQFHGFPLKEEKRFSANSAKRNLLGVQVHLLMPTTYMNESGQAVRKYMDYYRFTPEEVVVITDDVAIPFGEIRLRHQGSSGGHNGLKSIQQHLGTIKYPRLRIGIGRHLKKEQEMKDYVLDPFSRKEIEDLPAILNKGIQALEALLTNPIENVMNAINIKIKEDNPEKQIDQSSLG